MHLVRSLAWINQEERKLKSGENDSQEIRNLDERVLQDASINKPLAATNQCSQYDWKWHAIGILHLYHVGLKQTEEHFPLLIENIFKEANLKI